jgi:hypothetical protein
LVYNIVNNVNNGVKMMNYIMLFLWKIDLWVSWFAQFILNKLFASGGIGYLNAVSIFDNEISGDVNIKSTDSRSLLKNVNSDCAQLYENYDITSVSTPHENLHNDTFYSPMFSSYECNQFHDLSSNK